MVKRNLRGRFVRGLMALTLGGSALQVSGCDPAVRDALLAGLQDTTLSLSDALISAYFISLEDESSGGTGGTGSTT